MTVKKLSVGTILVATAMLSGGNFDGVTPVRSVPGVRGSAVAFNGYESHLQAIDRKAFAFGNGMTVSLWVKPEKWSHMAALMGNVGDFQLLARGGGGLYFWKNNTHQFNSSRAKSLLWAPEKYPVKLNEWNHIAFSYDQKGHGVGYFNGKKVAEQRPGQEPKGQGIVKLSNLVGYKQAMFDIGFKYIGAVDEVYVYGRVLNEREIADLAQGKAPAGAQAAYLMDDPDDPGKDSSGSSRHLRTVAGPQGNRVPVLGGPVDYTAVAANDVLYAWSCSSLERVFQRDKLKNVKVAEVISAELAGNEYEAFQLVLTPAKTLKNTTLTVSDFKLGNVICPVEVRVVDYVKIPQPSNIKTPKFGANVFGESVSVYPGPEAKPGWYPDRLRKLPDNFTLKGGESKAFWITVKSPADAPAGIYRAKAQVKSADGTVLDIPLSIRVRGFSLPAKRNATHTAAAPHIKSVAPAHLDDFYRMLSRYSISIDDTKNQIKYSFAADGSIKLDTAAWDKEMKIAVEKYGAQVIFMPLFGMYGLPKGNNLVSRRLGVNVLSAPGVPSEEFKKRLAAYLKAVVPHLKAKGYLKNTVFTLVDEPHDKYDFALSHAVSAEVRKHAPELKIFITKWPTKEGIGCADIWCIGALQPGQIRKAIDRGERVEQYPNWHLLIDRPVMDRRMLGFQMFKYNLTGILHYSLGKWNDEEALLSPQLRYPDGRVIFGSGLVMYPDENGVPEPSIRIDTIRDALDDFEYLKMIERIAAARPQDPAAQEALKYAKNAAEKLVPCYESFGDGLKTGWKTLDWELDWRVLVDYRKGLMNRLEKLYTK